MLWLLPQLCTAGLTVARVEADGTQALAEGSVLVEPTPERRTSVLRPVQQREKREVEVFALPLRARESMLERFVSLEPAPLEARPNDMRGLFESMLERVVSLEPAPLEAGTPVGWQSQLRPAATVLILAAGFWAVPMVLTSGCAAVVKGRQEVKLVNLLATASAFLLQLTLVSLFPLADGRTRLFSEDGLAWPVLGFALCSFATTVHAKKSAPWTYEGRVVLVGSVWAGGFCALFLAVLWHTGHTPHHTARTLADGAKVMLGVALLGGHLMLTRLVALEGSPDAAKRAVEAQVAAGLWGAGAAGLRSFVPADAWFGALALATLPLGALASRVPLAVPHRRREGARPGIACGALLVLLFWAFALALLGPRLPLPAFVAAGALAYLLPAPASTLPAAMLGFLALATHAASLHSSVQWLPEASVSVAAAFMGVVAAWATGVAVTNVASDMGGTVVLLVLGSLEAARALASSLELALTPQMSAGASVLLSFAVLAAAMLVRERE